MKILIKVLTQDQFVKLFKTDSPACVSEYIWDRSYNTVIWDQENRQVMNLIFTNIDLLKKLFD